MRKALKPICPIKIAELFDRHAGALELYASTWTKHAADCVQEAFIALAAEPTMPERPAAWLFTVVALIKYNDSHWPVRLRALFTLTNLLRYLPFVRKKT